MLLHCSSTFCFNHLCNLRLYTKFAIKPGVECSSTVMPLTVRPIWLKLSSSTCPLAFSASEWARERISSRLAFTHTSTSPGILINGLGYITALPCPFKIQQLYPESFTLLYIATVASFSTLLRCMIFWFIQNQRISNSKFGAAPLSSFWMPSKTTPTSVCFLANS